MTESGNVMPSSYMSRKGYYGLSVIAGRDSHYKFRTLSMRCPGSTNDAYAWQVSSVYCDIIGPDNKWPEGYHVIGDEGFVNTNNFLIPYSGMRSDETKDSFNDHLSAMSQCIEYAFGMMCSRWGIIYSESSWSKWYVPNCTISLFIKRMETLDYHRKDVYYDDIPGSCFNCIGDGPVEVAQVTAQPDFGLEANSIKRDELANYLGLHSLAWDCPPIVQHET